MAFMTRPLSRAALLLPLTVPGLPGALHPFLCGCGSRPRSDSGIWDEIHSTEERKMIPAFIIKSVIGFAIPIIVDAVAELGATQNWDAIDEHVRQALDAAVRVPKPLRDVTLRVVDWLTDVASDLLSNESLIRDAIVALAKKDFPGACEVLREALFSKFLNDPASSVSDADKASITTALAKQFVAEEK
jgi:hypothetical protein